MEPSIKTQDQLRAGYTQNKDCRGNFSLSFERKMPSPFGLGFVDFQYVPVIACGQRCRMKGPVPTQLGGIKLGNQLAIAVKNSQFGIGIIDQSFHFPQIVVAVVVGREKLRNFKDYKILARATAGIQPPHISGLQTSGHIEKTIGTLILDAIQGKFKIRIGMAQLNGHCGTLDGYGSDFRTRGVDIPDQTEHPIPEQSEQVIPD